MGFLDKLKSLLPKVSVSREYFHAPSEQFSEPTDLMTYLIERITGDAWASFHCTDGGQDIMVQVTGDCINTCLEEVDVPAIARQIGLTTLAESTTCSDDRTMHSLPNASPAEFAEVANGIFQQHFKLPATYRIEGWLEG